MYSSRPDEEIADTINSRRGKELLGGQLRHNMTSNKKNMTSNKKNNLLWGPI